MKLVYFSFSVFLVEVKTLKTSKLAKLNEENLLEMDFSEIKTGNSRLPTYLFKEIETELT